MRKTHVSLRRWALMGVAAAAITGRAHAEEMRRFDIPPQSLAAALEAFGQQGDKEILYSRKDLSARMAPALKGEYEPQDALRTLIADTGLEVRRVNANTFIVEAGAISSGAPVPQLIGADGGARTNAVDRPRRPQAPETVTGSAVEGLVVTAQKRRENIQDVPIAISAFTQDKLEVSQIAGGPDLMTQVPNMTFTKTNFSSYSIQIRGIGTQAISATVDPAVAVAFNNTAFIRNRFFEQEFYDLERLEVLRGPQGTLYGRNATAGVVNILSAKPSFDLETKVSLDLANYQSRRLEGMINIPLVEDKAALRLAGAWTNRDGYVTNEITGNPIDGRDLWSTRLSLRVEPTDSISANLIWEHFEEDDDRLRSGKQLCKKHRPTDVGGVAFDPTVGGLQTPASYYNQGCTAASLYDKDSFQTPNGLSLPYYYPLGALGVPIVWGLDPYLSTMQSQDLRVIESTWDPQYRAENDLGELQIKLDLSDTLTLDSETAYNSDDVYSLQDFNRFNTAPGAFGDLLGFPREGILNDGVFCDPQLGCADRVVAVDLSTAKSRQFSQEFRLSSNYDGPFNFSLGANFTRYDTEDKYYVFINTLTLVSAYRKVGWPTSGAPDWIPNISDNHECLNNGKIQGDPFKVQQVTNCVYIDPNPIGSLNDEGHNYFLSRNPYKLISYAAFGETYYNITSDLKVTAGLRLTVDKKQAPVIPSWLLSADNAGYPVASVVDQEWREPTGRLAVDWKPDLAFTDSTLIYATAARGYKAGGANPPPATIVTYGRHAGAKLLEQSLTHPKTFDAEFVNAVEVGVKNTFLDGGLTLNLNGFYYDYDNYQLSQIVDRSAITQNFDASIWGLELEADWSPLENLRFSLKGGYENTRVADGEQAIDIMDRTAGNTDWIVARPFPTVPSNCILPTWLVTYSGQVEVPPVFETILGNPCTAAYQLGVDPITNREYVANPIYYRTGMHPLMGELVQELSQYPQYDGYPGFDPSTAPNNGEGFAKDLSGNELPNAPSFTATFSTDYTLPLSENWLMTLHTDLYYQSEAWWRIFNTDGYDKLKAYTNLNFAAIFTNEDSGWRVMAYVKNVMDRDSITGAFLNSDDTGLTTNVFLTEPRLYGVRITKEWTGTPWWIGASDSATPHPFTLELGGQIQQHDAPGERLEPSFLPAFSDAINPRNVQDDDLDSGDGREIKLTYAPVDSPLSVSFGARFGKTSTTRKFNERELGDSGCGIPTSYTTLCAQEKYIMSADNYGRADGSVHENHAVVDFSVGKDFGFGSQEGRSKLSVGVRHARLTSDEKIRLSGSTNWNVPDFAIFTDWTHDHHEASAQMDREFEGTGPIISWEASHALWSAEGAGRTTVDWSVDGGVLFGRQKTSVTGDEFSEYFSNKYNDVWRTPVTRDVLPSVDERRSKSITVPAVGASVGLSYEIQRLKLSSGYRWERYFDAIDAGLLQRRTYDRTIDGPYFKVAVGFGG